MRMSAAGSDLRAQGGFTLIELLVVVAIIGISVAGVMGAVDRAGEAPLAREAMRLAALLEAARAQARVSGQEVRWQATEEGFRLEGAGLGSERAPSHWLDASVRALPPGLVVLGPEPLIEPQSLTITSVDHPQRRWRIFSDGVAPFQAEEAGS